MSDVFTERENPSSAAPIIEFRGVSKTYPTGTHAIEDINIRITAGAPRARAKAPL